MQIIIELPANRTSTSMQVQVNARVEAENLQKLLTDPESTLLTVSDYTVLQNNGSVELSLLVTEDLSNTKDVCNKINSSLTNDKKELLKIYDISILKSITTEQGKVYTQKIPNTNKSVDITIFLSEEDLDKVGYGILREHEGKLQYLTTDSTQEEYYKILDDRIILHVNKFSVYSIFCMPTVIPNWTFIIVLILVLLTISYGMVLYIQRKRRIS